MGIQPERAGGIAVTNSVRYLRTDLSNIRKCYNIYKKGRIVLVEKMTNLVFSIIYKSFNRGFSIENILKYCGAASDASERIYGRCGD